MYLGDVSVENLAKYADDSRNLARLSRGDYGPVRDEARRRYPNTQLDDQPIPFVERYLAELSGLYKRPTVRGFPGATDADARKMHSIYAASGMAAKLSELEDSLWLQNMALALVLPGSTGKIRVVPVQPWQVEALEISDPIDTSDPLTWDRLVVRVPSSVVSGQIVYGRVELSRTIARRRVGGEWRGIYNDDQSNPFGSLPVVVAYRIAPPPGRWGPPVNEAVLGLQFALSMQESDNDLVIKHCAWPQKVIEGATLRQQVEQMSIGPDKVLALLKSGDPQETPPTYRIVQGQVPVEQLVGNVEHKIRLYCSMLGMDPSSFIRTNTAVTASARLFSAQDRQRHRSKIEPVLVRMESDLARTVAKVSSYVELQQLDSVERVAVRWAVLEPSADPASAAQAQAARYAAGTDSPSATVAREQGVSHAEALRRVRQNLKESRALGVIEPADEAATPTADTPADEAATVGGDVASREALNGAQVTAVLTITQEVSAGTMTPSAAFELVMMAFPASDPDAVRSLIDEAGKSEPADEAATNDRD